MAKLTNTEKTHLLDLLALIGERDMPSNNTEAMLVIRSGLDEETVAWGVAVLFNEGKGWLEHDEHPRTGERGYYLGERFESGGSIEKLHTAFQNKPKSVIGAEGDLYFDFDDDDPNDEWSAIDDDDDDDDGGSESPGEA